MEVYGTAEKDLGVLSKRSSGETLPGREHLEQPQGHNCSYEKSVFTGWTPSGSFPAPLETGDFPSAALYLQREALIPL